MNRRLTLAFLAATITLLTWPATAQPTTPTGAKLVTFTRDPQEVLGLLEGNVDLIGDHFGPLEFQRGVLALAQAQKIQVKVLTNASTAPNMKPLKAAGARVAVLPADFSRGAAGMVLVHGRAVIFPLKTGGYNVLRDQATVQGIANSMETYWRVASPY